MCAKHKDWKYNNNFRLLLSLRVHSGKLKNPSAHSSQNAPAKFSRQGHCNEPSETHTGVPLSVSLKRKLKI